MNRLKLLKDTAPHIDCGNIQNDIEDVLGGCVKDNLKLLRFKSNISYDDLYCLVSDILHDVHVSVPAFYNCYVEYYRANNLCGDTYKGLIFDNLNEFVLSPHKATLDDIYCITWNIIHDMIYKVYSKW